MDSATGKHFLMSLTEGYDDPVDPLTPDTNVADLTDKEKLALIRQEIGEVYKKNMDLVRKNKAGFIFLCSQAPLRNYHFSLALMNAGHHKYSPGLDELLFVPGVWCHFLT